MARRGEGAECHVSLVPLSGCARRPSALSPSSWPRWPSSGDCRFRGPSPLRSRLTSAYDSSQASQDVKAVTDGLQSFCNFTKGLAADGKLGQALPLLDLVPGGDSGFGLSDLCQSSVMAQVNNLPNPAHCSDLASLATSSALSLTNSRTANVAALTGLVCGKATSGSITGVPTQVPLDLQVDRTVTTAGLNLNGSGNQGPVSVTSSNGVTVGLHLDLQATFGYNWDNSFFYLVDTPSSKPTLTATATISIPNGTSIDAGIGILKASLTGSLTGTITLSATMTDPTGTGQLGFTLGSGGAGNTALATAQIGSIFNVGFGGSLTGSMTLTPDNIGSFQFPSGTGASFGVSIPDINNPPAQPFTNMTNFSNLLDNFENLSPRDLADGLGHLVQAIRGVEAAKTGVNLNVNLPFMQGSLADASKIEEALAQFLTDNVTTTTNTQTGGANAPYESPKFSSIQDLQNLLNGCDSQGQNCVGYQPSSGSAVGSSISISNLNFDPDTGGSPSKPKLSLTLGLSRASGSPISLDPGAQTAYPGSTNTKYGASTVQDTSPPSPAWTTDQWKGFQVVTADALHSGIVSSNTADTLTLESPWSGGQPTDGTGYSIKGKDPKTGTVNLGNLSQGGKSFLLNANASVPQATINPSYSASVTLVLDLEPAVTGNDCTGYFYNPVENPANAACPFVKTNGDGSQTVINSLPTAPDRIMVRTADSNGTGLPLFTFDAPIDTKVSVDAQAGFLDVHLDGDLKECTTNSSADCSGTTASGKHLIDVSLKPQADAAHNYDIPISQLFSTLTCSGNTCPGPASLIDVSVNGQAYASLTLSVPQAAAFFGGNPSVSTSLTMADITNPTNVNLDTSNLSKLTDFNFDPSNPRALFSAIVKGLQVLLQTLQNTSGAASTDNGPLDKALNTTIPVLNRSLKDLLASSEGGLGGQVTYDTTTVNSQTVGRITDAGKNWTASKYKGRSVVVGTDLMTIADNDATHLTLTANWAGAAPAAGTPYMINNELEAALGALTANPTNTLQDMVNVLNGLLGTDAVKFTVNESQAGNPMLELDVDWKPSYSTEAPIGFDLSQVPSIPDVLKSVVGVQASGVASFNANAELKLGLLLPMTTDTSKTCYLPTTLDPSALLNTLCIKADSSISAGVSGAVNGSVQVNIGPVAVALGDPADTVNHGAQAKAALSVGLGDTTSPSGTIESIGTFLSNVGVKFNDGSAVTCPSDTANTSSDPLAVCAALPLYVKSGSNWNPVGTNDEFFLRLPQKSDPTDTFDLAGADLSGGVPRFGASPDLTTIGTDMASQILDLNALNGGIDGYFQFAENALNLASDNGKLPLIGHDLQQGSAFLTNLQAQFDAALGSLASAGTVKSVEDIANNGSTSLQGLLSSNGLLPSGGKVTVGITCGSGGQLSSPAATVAHTLDSSNTGKDTQTYSYEIVAETSDGNGGTVAAPAGTAGSDTNIPVPLDAKDFNTITWTTASDVTYQIWRSTDGTSFYLLKDNATSGYVDNGTDTPGSTAYSAPSGGVPCDPNASVTNITGVTLEVIVGQGNVSSAQGCFDDSSDTANPCLGAGLGTPFSMGIPGLSFSAAGDPSQNLLSVKLGWKLHLKFGIDTTRGFFICSSPKTGTSGCAASGGDNPIAVGVALDIPSGMKLNIAFLQMCVANHSGTPDPCHTFPAASAPAFVGEFDVALNSPRNDGYITGADLAGGDLSSLITPTLQAAVNIDWDFLVDTSAGAALPGLGGEFKLGWSWSNKAPEATDPTIGFDNVYIDAGTFLSGVLGNVLDEVNKILDPIRPVIDVLEAPIPVLSDLSEAVGGPPITLITIAKAFSTLAGGPDLTAIDEVLQVVKFVTDLSHEISTLSGQTIHIPLGSFDVSGPDAKATTATPDNADQLQKNVQSCDSGGGSLPAQCNGQSTFDGLNSNSGSVLNDTKTSNGSETQYGFELTALKHPASLLSVLMGKDVELFAFDSGPLTLAFTYTQQFGPVYAPPPVLVVISGSASVSARIRVGFDTLGIREAIAAKSAGGVVSGILDGLYISTTDPANGQPIPAITLTGTLAAGAEVSVILISVGIEGGITLTINLLWNDPDNDGKLRFSEFLAGLNNPLCLFNFSGSLKAFIKLFIDIGFSPFDYEFSFDLVNVTLLDFSTNNSCAKPTQPPVLGAAPDSGSVKGPGPVLYLYGGVLGGKNFRNDGWGNDGGQPYAGADEKWIVTEEHDPTTHAYTGMGIDWQGHHLDIPDPNNHIQTVELDARGYGGAEALTMVGDSNGDSTKASFDKGVIMLGGNKADAVKVSNQCPNATACTVGNVYIDGGAGDDQINVGDANALVAGGPGNDQIQVGNGTNWLAGDGGDIASGSSALTYGTTTYTDPVNSNTATIVDPGSPIGNASTPSEAGGDGNDTIHVGLGANNVWGGGGDDSISVGRDSPLSTLPNTNAKFCNTPGVCVAKGDTIVGGTGNNHISSGSGDDTVWAGQQATFTDAASWTGVSGDGNNSVDTGSGTDTVYGGIGNDNVNGHSTASQIDTFYGGNGDDQLNGGDGNDKLYGGSDNDALIGGNGADYLDGGAGHDYLVGGVGDVQPKAGDPSTQLDGSGVPIRTVTLTPDGPNPPQDASNTLIGGGGSDHIWGGDHGDTVYGDYPDETCAPPLPGHAPYDVQYDETKEHVDDGNDVIFGGAGNDTISGGAGNDVIDTGAGSDIACGGGGNDNITAHSGLGQFARIWGGSGTDTIAGGNGNDQLFGDAGDDTITAGAGNNYIEGGDGNDVAYAGGGNGVIVGGTSTAGQRDNADPSDPPGTPNGDRLFGGSGVAAIIGDNGCVDMTGSGPEVSFPGAAVSVNSCHPAGSPNALAQALQLYDLTSSNTTLGGDDYIAGGQGPSMSFGGLGNDTIIGGVADDHIEGGPGNNYIEGGGANNDIIGGTSPTYIPSGTCVTGASTSCVPAGSNEIYGDDGTGGAVSRSTDGSNAVVADNGQITRAGVTPGWAAAALASNPITWGDGTTVPNRAITNLDIYSLAGPPDVRGADSWVFGGTKDDFLFGGPGNDHVYGGPPVVKGVFGGGTLFNQSGLFGNDYLEGGPGSDSMFGGAGQDDMIGGVSPLHLEFGATTSLVGDPGNHLEGGDGQDYVVADNGEIDHQCGPAGGPTVLACTTPSTPWTVDPNNGAYFRSVTLDNLLTIGGNSTLLGGSQDDHLYGGKGNDSIDGGSGDDYIMGAPGNDTITGGTGSNDIVGGTAPEVLAGGSTSTIPDGGNVIYADAGAANPADGSNVVIGNNGDIVRQHNGGGVWIRSNNDPTDQGIVQRTIVNLDIYGYPLPAEPGAPDLQGLGNVIFGGSKDDILLGGPANDAIYGGPPGGGTIVDPTTGKTFAETQSYGNDWMEGGPGSDVVRGAAGDDDIIGGVSPFYLLAGHDTGTVNDSGNLLFGGPGNDFAAGGNARIDHLCGPDLHVCAPIDPTNWEQNSNDLAFVRRIQLLNLDTSAGPTGPITTGIGGNDTISGGAGDDHLYGGNGNDNIDGGPSADYAEGGPGSDLVAGGGGDDDLIGGTAPASLPPPPAGQTNDQVAGNTPDGSNIICGFECGKSMVPGATDPATGGNTTDNDAIVANNGRIDRCAAVLSGGVGTPQGSDSCTWTSTAYGNAKVSSSPGVAQSGLVTNVSLGNPRTRFITLLGQSPTETTHAGTDYVEGNGGNDVMYGEDGSDVIHGDTPAQNAQPAGLLSTAGYPQYVAAGATFQLANECLPTSDPQAGQDIAVGGYGNDVLCGDGGDDGLVGNRGSVTVVPFSLANKPVTIGGTNGPPYGTFTFPGSGSSAAGNTIYQVDLSLEYVNGVMTAVPNWNNPAATGQSNQHDIIFGGQGNDTIHGSPGDDLLQGDDGIHAAGQPASAGGDDILFGGGGSDSMQGGPGNDQEFGGAANDDLDVIRSDTAIPFKINESEVCQPMLFPTITLSPTSLLTAAGCPTTGFGIQSYASRFPAAQGQTYDTDPGANDNGGTTSHTNTFGDVLVGGFNRDMYQSQNTGFGDRMIDDHGAYDIEFVCPAAYGGWQIVRAESPGMQTFQEQLSQADGAVNTATPTSSGGTEASIVYPGDSKGNTGKAYPTTPGHFTC